MTVENKRMEEDEFFIKRKEVLSRWPTGKAIDLEDAVQYRKQLSEHAKLFNALSKGKKEGRMLVGLHLGRATTEEVIDHMEVLGEAGADFFYLLPDTYTRHAKYAEAENGLQESIKRRKSILNGFPIVNHGLKSARRIRESTDVPISFIDSDSELCELTTEMALAAGFDNQSGDVESMLRVSKNYSLEKRIQECQYQDRLVGYYAERGAHVLTNLHNNLCGYDPPEIKIALCVLHCLLSAEQGVKNISLEIGAGNHIIQDAAALKTLKQLGEEYLQKYGYDVNLFVQYFPYSGHWPRERNRATVTCAMNVVIPILAGANWSIMKSFDEARGIHGKEGNLSALHIGKQLISVIGKQRLDEGKEFSTEKEMITLGASAIIEKTIELGNGDAALGQVRAVEAGIIDAAFSPYKMAKGKALPLRDATGAVRYVEFGNIPLPDIAKEYHRQKIEEREKTETDKKIIDMMIKDVYYMAQIERN